MRELRVVHHMLVILMWGFCSTKNRPGVAEVGQIREPRSSWRLNEVYVVDTTDEVHPSERFRVIQVATTYGYWAEGFT